MKRIPIKVARDLGKKLGMNKTVLICFESDGKQHVVTWGKDYNDCVDAAKLGNDIKRALGWAEYLCHGKPARQIRKESILKESAVKNIKEGGNKMRFPFENNPMWEKIQISP